MKRNLIFCVLMILVLAFMAACAPTPAEPVVEEPVVEEPEVVVSEAEEKCVAMVTHGSMGDGGIFDLAGEALEKAKADLGVNYTILEGKMDPSLYFGILQTAAETCELVLVNPGYQFAEQLGQLAPQYPDTVFIWMDGLAGVDEPNVSAMATADNEGSYLAGMLAGGMTVQEGIEGINPDKFIGLVGAMDAPTINNFIAGFRHGVRSMDEEIEVQVLYAGTFGDPAKGKELATSLIDDGADIVYNVAALTGQGVLLAAQETGQYAIGVDSDQCDIQPGHILASMMKRFENTTYLMVQAFLDGEITGGEVYRYGLADGGVELRFCPQTSDIVPAELVAAIEEARVQIISGELEVDSFFD